MVAKAAEELWQDYRFLTKEMLKFLTQQDMELFYNLMKQRERLQTLIEQTANNGFKVSTAGRKLLNEIKEDNENISRNMQLQLNRSKRHHQVSEVYSGASTAPSSRMNWKR